MPVKTRETAVNNAVSENPDMAKLLYWRGSTTDSAMVRRRIYLSYHTTGVVKKK